MEDSNDRNIRKASDAIELRERLWAAADTASGVYQRMSNLPEQYSGRAAEAVFSRLAYDIFNDEDETEQGDNNTEASNNDCICGMCNTKDNPPSGMRVVELGQGATIEEVLDRFFRGERDEE